MKVIEYRDEHGAIEFPGGFAEKLAGKTPEEQMEHFRITESVTLARTSYGELDREDVRKSSYRLEEYPEFRGLIVRAGIIVGALIESARSGKEIPCPPYWRVCTYYASDNNGAGYKERCDYAYLICA